MERIIARLLEEFDRGDLNRRQLIRKLAAAVGASSTLGPLVAEDVRGFKPTGIHHISYYVADYKRSRDFYAGLFDSKVSMDTGSQCSLAINDIDLSLRNGKTDTPFVEHIAYSIENWDKAAVFAELKRRGLDPQPERENSFKIKDPDGYHVELIAKK